MTAKRKKGLILYGSGSLLIIALLAVVLYVTQGDRQSRDSEYSAPPPTNTGTEDAADGQRIEENTGAGDGEDAYEREGERYQFQLYERESNQWLKASELAISLGGVYQLDTVNRVLDLTLFNVPFSFIDGVPVVERNGVFLPLDMELIFDLEEEEVYLPFEFLIYGLKVEATFTDDMQFVNVFVEDEALDVFSMWEEEQVALDQFSSDDLISYLSFLSNPIPGASISTRDSHLPGARRSYRNGYHEGIDWYGGTSGIPIGLDTPVLSVADGVVVRADHDYVEMTKEERDAYLALSAQLPDTPQYILDKLRGRSVWVQYEHGVMVRYVHLSSIADGIEVGSPVKQGQILGYVGNSGTSYAIDGDVHGGLHLHADLLIYGDLFWTYLDDPTQIRRVLENTFHD